MNIRQRIVRCPEPCQHACQLIVLSLACLVMILPTHDVRWRLRVLPGVRAILVLPAGCQRMILPAGYSIISPMT
jgi:hypothetical protein